MLNIKVKTENLKLWYGKKLALDGVSLGIYENKITALIGPSGCGKSTYLRCLNRMNDLIDGIRIEGKVIINGRDIYAPEVDEVSVRKKVGMVFQQPNPFPKSIYDNVAYAPLMHDMVKKGKACDLLVEKALKDAGLWDEVKDILNKSGTNLSGGQQQRLCIARAIAVEPEVILMDEPTSALDPISTQVIENLMTRLKEKYTIIIVTHNMQQASRISDTAAFFHLGKLIEHNKTEKIFLEPEEEMTEQYITGKFG
ncbi:MAG: phosphate ABC transporter ATP-binding protein [Sulfurovum sp.]|nr:phosphate ABC transporter ATP-binding protein [Sulfurovum sp.]